ncbi:hypothetical protein N7490_010948 [Penicillium lividum]|nr:hypothetical protein N7490_010948 [Penicillium lividum]
MSKEAPLSNVEHDFILKAIKEGTRLDGREADQYRPLSITFGEEYGSVKVQLGKTALVVRISASVVKPREDKPFDGLFDISMELTSLGSPAWESGRSSDLETSVTHILDRVIRHSNAIDTESLCIVKGVSCWSIRADILVIDFDGNLTDTACIGVMTGLQHFRRPDAVVRDGKVIVYKVEDRVPVPLNITHKPLSITFNSYNNGKNIIVDATRKEEQAAEGDMVVGINSGGEVCFMSKFSGHPVSPMTMVRNVDTALEKVKELNVQIDKVLQIDLAKRAKLGMAEEGQATNDR